MAVAEALTGHVLRLHQRLYESSDGRMGHKMLGVPTLLLRTTGRRSGATRTNGLVYARDGDEYLVVASNGGADQAPGWLFNVKANPDAEVPIGRDPRGGTWRVVERGDPDFDRQGRIVNENNSNRYDAYQEKTGRSIPIVAVRAG